MRKFVFIDHEEFQKILVNLDVANTHIWAFLLKIIQKGAALVLIGLFISYYYWGAGESTIRTYFKQELGDMFGPIVTIVFLSVFVCILFFAYKFLFHFILPKILLFFIGKIKKN